MCLYMSHTPIQIDSQDVPWVRYTALYLGVALSTSLVVSLYLWAYGAVVGAATTAIVLFGQGVFLVVVLFYYVTQLFVRGLNNTTTE